MIRLLIVAGASLGVVGCTIVGPDYVAPSTEVPSQFVHGGGTSLVNGMVNPWWERLNDPLLNELVVRGARQNLDIRAAIERISAANAALGRNGVNAQLDGDAVASISRQGTPSTQTTNRDLQVNGAYVLDLFGGFARGTEQAQANFDAAQLDVGTVRLAYLADLTNAYIQARYFQEAAAITRQTISSRRRILGSVEQRLQLGEATELDRQQARSLLATAEAALPVLNANFEVNVFRIATLLAEPAEPLMSRMQQGARQPRPSGFTTVGLPADLLRNRPDVRFAERNYAAATAAIGVAEAQLYPSVNLSGTIGTGTNDRWAFGPTITLPVLNRGFLRSRALIAQSQAREAELTWRQSVLRAVEDVQVALTLCLNWNRQLQTLERASQSSRSVLNLSQESYTLGSVTLTDVLDAERIHAGNRLAVADAVRNYTVSWMQVQVATGQGWATPELVAPAEVSPPRPVPRPLALEAAARTSTTGG